MPIKVAMIGAGSIGFTRRLIQDLLGLAIHAEESRKNAAAADKGNLTKSPH